MWSSKKQIHQAIINNQLSAVKALVKKHGATILEYRDAEDRTPLITAVCRNRLDIVKYLVAQGAAIEAHQQGGATALHWAAHYGWVDIAQWLLEQRAAVNAVTSSNTTALHIAVAKGNQALVECLLCHKPDLSIQNIEGSTILQLAAGMGHAAIVGLLIDHGADVNAIGEAGQNALYWAIECKNEQCAKLLLAHQAVMPTEIDGELILHRAVRQSDGNAVTFLLEHNANLEQKEAKYGFTPLLVAVNEGDDRMVALLLAHDANINAQANNGATALHLIAEHDNLDCLEWLLLQGADLEITDQAGNTPLIEAVKQKNGKVIAKLLQAGANIEAKNHKGQNVISYAMLEGDEECANILRQHLVKQRLQALRQPAPAPVLPSQILQGLQQIQQQNQQLLADNQGIKARLDALEQTLQAPRPPAPR